MRLMRLIRSTDIINSLDYCIGKCEVYYHYCKAVDQSDNKRGLSWVYKITFINDMLNLSWNFKEGNIEYGQSEIEALE